MKRIERLSHADVYVLAKRAYRRVEATMNHPGNGYQPYGWDWPTANVLHPTLVRMYRRAMDEFKRRAEANNMTVYGFQLIAVPKHRLTTGRRRFRRQLLGS